jgi:hypothetical protein
MVAKALRTGVVVGVGVGLFDVGVLFEQLTVKRPTRVKTPKRAMGCKEAADLTGWLPKKIKTRNSTKSRVKAKVRLRCLDLPFFTHSR